MTPEHHLSKQDSRLAEIIGRTAVSWQSVPTENPIWGLMRIVMAQQVSTLVAYRLAGQVRAAYPHLVQPCSTSTIEVEALRKLGLPASRANCCVNILKRSDEILAAVAQGETWENALVGIKGIGPWTIAVFKIMVLREPDVLPLGDVGLERAITNVYGRPRNVEQLAKRWEPFRSVACWYLWRTLGNVQLG